MAKNSSTQVSITAELMSTKLRKKEPFYIGGFFPVSLYEILKDQQMSVCSLAVTELCKGEKRKAHKNWWIADGA
jgi:hypothetical protein